MNQAEKSTAETAASPFRGSLAYVIFLLALLAWQGWMTLSLFGDERPWQTLLDDQPILSGSHPQNLYLGALGSQSLHRTGRSCCFDPAFQAGYPKTPLFNGSRTAELFMFLGGGGYQPAAYKMGLALVCLLVPVFLLVAAWGAGLGRSVSLAAVFFGQLLWWGPTARQALEAGESEVLVASLAVLAHVGLLVRFDRAPGFWVWLGLVVTGCIGWFTQPLLFPIVLPLLLTYYLSVGVKHGSVDWHASLWLAEVLGVAVNLPWLWDWMSFWWIRAPLPSPVGVLRHRTLETLWNAPLWGGPGERSLALGILLSAVAGVLIWNQTQQRPAARLFGLGAGLLYLLTVLGISWAPLGEVGTAGLLVPSLWFAVFPAVFAWSWLFQRIAGLVGGSVRAGFAAAMLLLPLGLYLHAGVRELAEGRLGAEPFVLGLGPEREAVVAKLIAYTGPEARILWEDRPGPRTASRWAALLPLFTERAFIGGLDPDGTIEHASISFSERALDGRPISTWNDQALAEYCRRYNVGWIVCWSPATIQRFRQWQGVEAVEQFVDDGAGLLFRVKDSPRNYALKGRAEVVHADSHHITLAEVVPENGVVVLSLHYQAGLRASPSRVQVERDPCAHDPIGFVRLRVAGPVARVTLAW